MEAPPASMRNLARRLLALEAARPNPAAVHMHQADLVCEKLRVSVSRFAGPDGFNSLLRRAVALAREEIPALANVRVKSNGTLEGIGELNEAAGGGETEAAVVITAHLLGLLVTFIGEPLTLRLVRYTWPDASFDNTIE